MSLSLYVLFTIQYMMHKDVNITDDRASLSCRDPIIRTSTVDGLCMKAEHCANLAGSECKTVAGTEYMTCQCIPGLSPGTEGHAVVQRGPFQFLWASYSAFFRPNIHLNSPRAALPYLRKNCKCSRSLSTEFNCRPARFQACRIKTAS